MKSFIVSGLAALLGLALTFTPLPAMAGGPIDCTKGCEIVTCDRTYCTVWWCDSGGCVITGGYARKYPKAPQISISGKPAAFDAVCDVSGRSACAIKTCANGSCTVSLFDQKAKSFVPIGETDDVGRMIDKANSTLNR